MSAQRARRRSAAAAVFAGAFLATMLVVPNATAVGGTCYSHRDKVAVSWSPDKYRVGAYCASLQSDSKARGTLIVNASVDEHTSWFTTKNVMYHSSYRYLFGWEVGGTRVQIQSR